MLQSKNLNVFSLAVIIFSIPFFEFVRDNINEINIILGKSFYFLLLFTFLLILLGTFIINSLSKNRFSRVFINFSDFILDLI